MQDSNRQHRAGLPDAGFVREAQLVPGLIPVSRATLWAWVKSEQFPSPVRLSPGCTAWRVEDVRRWMDERPSALPTRRARHGAAAK